MISSFQLNHYWKLDRLLSHFLSSLDFILVGTTGSEKMNSKNTICRLSNTQALIYLLILLMCASCGGGSGGGDSSGSSTEVTPPPNEVTTPPPATCQDNDTVECADPLTGNNPSITGHGNSSNDVHDYFEYTPSQSGTVTVTLSGFGANDFDLFLRSSSGVVIDSSESVNTQERIVFTASAGATYFISVMAYQTSGMTISYDLNIALSSNTNTPPPPPPPSTTSTMSYTIIDSCNDGYLIRYKLYDVDNDLVWPTATTHFSTQGLNRDNTHSLACRTGARICYGGSLTPDGSGLYWGVGLFGNQGCSTCCYTCTNGGSVRVGLTCGSRKQSSENDILSMTNTSSNYQPGLTSDGESLEMGNDGLIKNIEVYDPDIDIDLH
ncbi:MAG: PPC domain-containing protein [Candidatus Thiodiazotropha lotti]|nr:PPC domain-containing protein [Candidatus Thiodiazotropha lotti]MCW4219398.1 PPC domain-containing protein [Candidatus Thiodiazotropha lotti]